MHLREILQKERGDLEQINFLLGHSSVQTTERYISIRSRTWLWLLTIGL